MPNRIVKGDTVVVTTGREKGKQGVVEKVYKAKGRVMVGQVNMVKRHTKPSKVKPDGGIIEKAAPLQMSNVMLIDPKDGRGTRVGFKETDTGWTRIAKRSGQEIPYPKR